MYSLTMLYKFIQLIIEVQIYKKIPEQNSVRGEHIYKKVGLLAYLT